MMTNRLNEELVNRYQAELVQATDELVRRTKRYGKNAEQRYAAQLVWAGRTGLPMP